MHTYHEICTFISKQQKIVELLEIVEKLELHDAWIGAGLIRNAVWDYLHGYEIIITDRSDIDVIYFDKDNASETNDKEIENTLKVIFPKTTWEVRNQALMNNQNGDPPYQSTEDAMRFWPETATAIAARTVNKRIELLAPFGIDDLIGLIIRPNPIFSHKHKASKARVTKKGWKKRWPKLRTIQA